MNSWMNAESWLVFFLVYGNNVLIGLTAMLNQEPAYEIYPSVVPGLWSAAGQRREENIIN